MIDRTNGTHGFVRKRARECSSTRALEPSHSKTTRALELLHSSTRALELEKYSHTTRMTSANHSREFFHSRISSTRPVLYMYSVHMLCTRLVHTLMHACTHIHTRTHTHTHTHAHTHTHTALPHLKAFASFSVPISCTTAKNC